MRRQATGHAAGATGPSTSVGGRMLGALGFFALVEVVGLAAAPLAALAFGRLPGAGLGFAKPLGVLLATWAVWMLVSLHIVHYSTATAVAVLIALVVAGVAAALRQRG